MATPDDIFLSLPDEAYRDSYVAAAKEFLAEGHKPDWNLAAMRDHFDEYIEVMRARYTDPMPGYVPQTDYWLIVAVHYAGRISIRHSLNESLERFGGHIGYEIRPSMRRRGYGKLMCRLGIEKARELGLTRLLITCDDDNVASARIIEANGGVLQDRVDNGRRVLTRRYWVEPD